MIGHRLMGTSLLAHGRHRGRPSASRSRARALRSCRASSAGDAFWPRRSGGNLIVIGRWPCGCLAIPRLRSRDAEHALKDAREIGQAATLMHALTWHEHYPYLLRKLRGSKRACSMNLSLWRTKKAPRSGSRSGMMYQGCVSAPDRQSLGRRPNDHLRDRTHGGQWEQHCTSCVSYHIWRGLCENSANSMMLGAALAKRLTAIETTKERWFEAEVHRIAGEIALKSLVEPDAAKAEAYFRARARGRASAASKILGTPRRDEHGAALARSGQAG